ncbi:MAG: glycosyltransferase [Bacteroidia bacterium]|nr:glycosyltransferase [Bacteroidia bacterium]
MKKTLHIVAFDVPFPADYGGVIDIYHKIRTLNKLGIGIILHCFQYGRPDAPELNSICKKVYYYKRSKYKNPFIGETPYIVSTRNHEELLINLCKDQHPIIFEGLHCTYFLNHEKLSKRIRLVRNHNIEHDYYKNLEKVENNYFKKYFFRNESDKLKSYEKHLKSATKILAISPPDHQYLNKKYHNSMLVPAFHANDQASIQTGKGKFILYHGNLGVGENNFAALFLINEVFSKLKMPCIIAGSHPSDELIKACQKYAHIQLIDNWSNAEIMEAISNAQINVLPTFQGTGIKLKLLNALYCGRFCIANELMIHNTTLENACILADKGEEMVEKIKHYWQEKFTENDLQNRVKILSESLFDNEKNARLIIDLMA